VHVLWVGEVVGVRMVDLCFKGKYETIRCAMYLERQNIYLRIRYDGWIGGMMRSSRGFENGQQIFSRVCVCVLFVFGFCCFDFEEWVPWFWELQRITSRSITERMGVVLCKDSWSNDWGKSMCCILVFCLVKWNNGIKEIWLCDLCGSKDFERGQWA